MTESGRKASKTFSRVCGIATVAGFWLALGAPPEANATDYRYEARLQASSRQQGQVKASGIVWTCKKNLCTVTGPWPIPGVSACAALAKQVGKIVSYGHPGQKLDAAQLGSCNGGTAAGAIPRGAPQIAKAVKNVPVHGAQAAAAPPSVKNVKPIAGPSPVSQAVTEKIGRPGVRGIPSALPEHVSLELPELAIVRAEVIEESSTLMPGGRVLVKAYVRNTAAPSPAVELQTLPTNPNVDSERVSIPRNSEREVMAYVPIGTPRGNPVSTTLQLAQGQQIWSDQNAANNRASVSYRIGRPELAIEDILGVRDQPVRVGDRVDLRARVRNTGNAPAEVDVHTSRNDRNPISDPRSPPTVEPGRTLEIPFLVEVRPEHVGEGEYRDTAFLVNARSPGNFVDSSADNNRRPFSLAIVGHDLAVTGVSYAWARGFVVGGRHPFSWTVGIQNTMDSRWDLGGYVDVVLYNGTPEAGLRWAHAYRKSVPPIGGRNRTDLTHSFGRIAFQPGVWHTLRAQLVPHGSDGDLTNDCYQVVWFQPTSPEERSERSARFDCASERIDASRPAS